MDTARKLSKCGLPLIGPHGGRELELMLAGLKPMAKFTVEPGMDPHHIGDPFEPYVEQGLFVKFTVSCPPPAVEKRWYCRKGQEWRGKLSRFIDSQLQAGTLRGEFSEADLHRIGGYLLGYPQECIDHMVERSQARRRKTSDASEA